MKIRLGTDDSYPTLFFEAEGSADAAKLKALRELVDGFGTRDAETLARYDDSEQIGKLGIVVLSGQRTAWPQGR